MATTRVKIAIVDDNPEEREHLRRKLSRFKDLQVVPYAPPADLQIKKVIQEAPDAVLIDYQLNQKEEGRPTASYKGSTLAAALREKLSKTPILLLTKTSLIGNLGAARDVKSAYEQLCIKEDIYKNIAHFHRDLLRLIAGFRELAKEPLKDWNAILRVLEAEPDEEELLRKAEPPASLLSRVEAARVTEVARWIRTTLLEFPGILYSPRHAAAALGLDVKSFMSVPVQTLLKGSRYRGIFAPEEGCWWVERLVMRARGLLRRAHMKEAALSDFPAAWLKVKGKQLHVSICNTSNQPSADAVCYILKEPVMRQYSLPYYPDNRPACMDVARVSFKAIKTTNAFDERLVASDARQMAIALQRGDFE